MNEPRALSVKKLAPSVKAKKQKCKERGIQGQMRRYGDREIRCWGGVR